jgi:alpha-D-xyloside xylohydrolase
MLRIVSVYRRAVSRRAISAHFIDWLFDLAALTCLILMAAGAAAQPTSLVRRGLWSVAPSEVPSQGSGVLLQRGAETLRLQVCSPTIVRVTYMPNEATGQVDGSMLLPSSCLAQASTGVLRLISSDASAFRFATSALQIEVSAKEGAVRFKDTAGVVLVSESTDPEPREIGQLAGHGRSMTEIFRPQEGERFYGLGQHQSGVWNYAGESVELTQDNTNISIPFVVSNHGYGLFWNNGGDSRFNNRFAQRLYLSSKNADAIDYFFVYGPELDKVVKGYRDLTGQAPLFSRSAYGFWQSKNRYESQQQILDAAKHYRDLKMPIDNIVQDWFWWTRMGSHIFNSSYPEPQQMVDELHREHFHVMISVWPFFEPGSENYDAFRRADHLIYNLPSDGQWLPGAGLYDPFSTEARLLYWTQIDRALFRKGFDAWWLDTTEPETINTETNAMETAKTGMGDGSRVADLFPLMTTTAVYQGQRAQSEEKRVFILTRSASAGMQRNAAAAWSGDIFSTWDALRRQIPAGLNYSLSGLPYWTTDIGGFTSGDPDDPAYRELFVRWFEYGAFCPVFRVHGTRKDNRNELWSYGPEAQAVLTRIDALRYRLLPYIYSTAWQVTSQGSTMMRPLVMDFRKDENAGAIGDQFLFGTSLMVSPVTHQGETMRQLYLPTDTIWFDFWTGLARPGGRFVQVAAPLETIPLHVRAGSILPLGPTVEYADQDPDGPIELRVYPGADGDFVLYADAGDGYQYEKGLYATIAMRWDDGKKTLSIGDRKGTFPGMAVNRTFRVVWVREGHGIGGDQEPLPDREITYDGHAVEVRQAP